MRNNNIQMLKDTLSIFKAGYYKKSGKKIELSLSDLARRKSDVLLP